MQTSNSISTKDALELWEHVVRTASNDGGVPVSSAVVDAYGQPLVAQRMDGAPPFTFMVALSKAQEAVQFGKDTIDFAHVWDEKDGKWKSGPADHNRLDDNRRSVFPNYVSWAGGILIREYSPNLDGAIIGGLGVSARDQLDDHKLAIEALKRWREASGWWKGRNAQESSRPS